MDTMVISCPECDKQIRAPVNAAGKKIRCKSCEHVFIVKAPNEGLTKTPNKPPAPDKPAKPDKPAQPAKPAKPSALDDEEEDPNPYGIEETHETPRCPQCAAEMGEGDIICLNCGFNTRSRERVATRKVKDVTGGDKFVWQLPGILAAVGVVLLIGYAFFHFLALPGILVDNWDQLIEKHSSRIEVLVKESENIDFWKKALIHPGVVVWIFVPVIFACYKLTRFAIKRLIYESEPPEIELKG